MRSRGTGARAAVLGLVAMTCGGESPPSIPEGGSTSTTTQGATTDPASTAAADDTTGPASTTTEATAGDSGSSGSSGGDRASAPAIDPCAGVVDTPSRACSLQSSTMVELEINSACSERVLELWWVNFDCGEVSYGLIEPGSSITSQTYVTHVWRIRDAVTGDLVLQLDPLIDKNLVVDIP